jgi:hypothetical protein
MLSPHSKEVVRHRAAPFVWLSAPACSFVGIPVVDTNTATPHIGARHWKVLILVVCMILLSNSAWSQWNPGGFACGSEEIPPAVPLLSLIRNDEIRYPTLLNLPSDSNTKTMGEYQNGGSISG